MKNIQFILQLLAAIIMVQTLYFKFTAAPESVYIFSQIGLEPYGRIGIGILELMASILLFVPRATWLGALLGVGLMMGAIQFHVTTLGVEVQNDGGKLFVMALITFCSCVGVLYLEKQNIQKEVRNVFGNK